MPIDPNIPLEIQAPQNPIQSIQAPLQTAQGLLALKQNQMQLGANQAISQAYSQSVNPDGSVDFNKLQALAAQNGAGAFLPQFMGQIAQQRNSQLQYDTGKLALAQQQNRALLGRIGSLAGDPNLGKSDMTSAIASQLSDAVQAGIVPLDAAVREIQNIPSEPSAQAGWIQNHFINSLSDEAKITALMPQNVQVNTGAGTALLNRNPITGQTTPGTFVQSTLSPEQLTAPKTIIGPNGEQRQVTTAQWLQMQGGGNVPGQPAEGASGTYTGRYNPQSQGAPGVQTSLGPAQQAGLTAAGTASSAAAQDLHNAAADAPMRLNLLENARDALTVGVDANGHPIDTGPGAAWRNEAKSFFNALSPQAAKAVGWSGDVQSFDEFKKILTNYASSVSGSLGTGTDARLNAAVTGNANPNISSLANQDILAKTIAAEKLRAAQDYAFQNSGLTPDKFNQWQTQWNNVVDPQAFVYASMSPDQRAAFQKRLSPQQLQTFRTKFNGLVNQGILQLPGGGQ